MKFAKKTVVKIVIFLVVFVGIVGMRMTMVMDDHGTMMAGCPFMGETGSLCQMSILEHIAKWESLFSATISFDTLLLLFVIVAFVALSRVFLRALAPPERVPVYHEPPDIAFFKPLLVAFSRGVIHPKLYS